MKSQRIRRIEVTIILTLVLSGYFATSAMATFYWGNYATTPCGSNVYCRMSDNPSADDYTPAQKASIAASFAASYPEAVITGDATPLYNCHGYAWIPSTLLWLNNPAPYIDSYDDVGLEYGDKITYAHCVTHGPTHSANNTGYYQAVSKWGSSCRCLHDWDYVPGSYGSVASLYIYEGCDACGHSDCGF